jgi:signal transduction histidine kinase
VADRFRTQTDKHEIVVRFPDGFPLVQGDQVRLEQVLNNLVSNAIKYTPQGGRIEISGQAKPSALVVTVSDTGEGIPIEEQTRVFERFYRGARERRRRTPGAGLGLYLAKAIVEAHGGSMRLESRPGEGAAFSFALPREGNLD